jgi:hypothetical protein
MVRSHYGFRWLWLGLLMATMMVAMRTLLLSVDAFTAKSAMFRTGRPSSSNHSSQTTRYSLGGGVSDSIKTTTSLVIAAEEWRQYVSLAIVAGVLLDIVLGSPLANAALKPLRDAQESLQEESAEQKAARAKARSKERIDSDKVAQEAIDKAQNALELRKYLDSRKSGWDRMEELKRDLDRNMQDLDEDLKARQEALDRKSKN